MKLNVGSGDRRLDGYISVDITGADVNHDLGVFPWPFENDSADEILASHVLEHFDRDTGLAFLRECRRILKPGGRLLLAVPDMDKFIDCRNSGDYTPLNGYHWRSLDTLLGGDDSEPNTYQRHKYMWSEWSLTCALMLADFASVERRGRSAADNPQFEPISLYMVAWK